MLLASLEFPSEAFRILSAPLKKYLQAQCQRLPYAMGDGAGGADKKYNVPIKGGLPLCTKLAFSMLIQIIDFKEHIFVQRMVSLGNMLKNYRVRKYEVVKILCEI